MAGAAEPAYGLFELTRFGQSSAIIAANKEAGNRCGGVDVDALSLSGKGIKKM